jgi:hypothetical protein
MGTANLLCSIPSGYWADCYRRDTVLQVAAVVRAVAITTAIYAIVQAKYIHLLLALALWGSSRGAANTALGAIFADSIPQGQRSYYFTQRTMLRTIGSTAGPIVSCIMFVVLGDHWTLHECSIVLMVGQVISIAAMITLFCFNDDYIVMSAGEEGEHDDEEEDLNYPHNDETVVTHDLNQEAEQETLIPPMPHDHHEAAMDAQNHDVDSDNNDLSNHQYRELEPTLPTTTTRGWLYQRRVAILVATSDIITGLASGMSVRYFPIFFVT